MLVSQKRYDFMYAAFQSGRLSPARWEKFTDILMARFFRQNQAMLVRMMTTLADTV